MGEPETVRKIALFGGTFDPVHSGHLEIAAKAVEELSLDLVIFLPCRQSPHKAMAAGASQEERLEMIRLAIQGLPWAQVSDWEYHQPIPSYSWRTAEVFAEEYADAQLHWLMGQDQWKVLSTWSRADYLSSLVRFIVHDRDGVRKVGEQEAYFISGDHPASSSKIRESILEGNGKNHQSWLPAEVWEYLQKERLYCE